jgi:hypothetical protein
LLKFFVRGKKEMIKELSALQKEIKHRNTLEDKAALDIRVSVNQIKRALDKSILKSENVSGGLGKLLEIADRLKAHGWVHSYIEINREK